MVGTSDLKDCFPGQGSDNSSEDEGSIGLGRNVDEPEADALQANGTKQEDTQAVSPVKKKKKRKKVCLKKLPVEKYIQRRGLHPDAKVFVVKGNYGVLRDALEGRGWVENTDEKESTACHFKWTCKLDDVGFKYLRDDCIANHFHGSSELITKHGLSRNLKAAATTDGMDINSFYPRTYSLKNPGDIQDFIDDFIGSEALSVLQRHVRGMVDANNRFVTRDQLSLAILVLRKYRSQLVFPGENKGDVHHYHRRLLHSPREWRTLFDEDSLPESLVMSFVESTNTSNPNDGRKPLSDFKLTEAATEILEEHREHNPQFHLNGVKNIWIVKSTHLSRGRGIRVYHTLKDIMAHAYQKKFKIMVQKYLETPMLVADKKFDIRQWVLVTDWNPLTVWFLDDCYLRFCSTKFKLSDFHNRYIHLTNRSVQKNYEEGHYGNKIPQAEDSQGIENNMMSSAEFETYLREVTGENKWKKSIQPRMKEVVISSLMSTMDSLDHRKNSFEIYGYDFILDDNHKPWLLEVNCSPDMAIGATPILDNIVKSGIQDLLKVVIDVGSERVGRIPVDAQGKGKMPGTPDTGKWCLIHRGKAMPETAIRKLRCVKKNHLLSRLVGRPSSIQDALRSRFNLREGPAEDDSPKQDSCPEPVVISRTASNSSGTSNSRGKPSRKTHVEDENTSPNTNYKRPMHLKKFITHFSAQSRGVQSRWDMLTSTSERGLMAKYGTFDRSTEVKPFFPNTNTEIRAMEKHQRPRDDAVSTAPARGQKITQKAREKKLQPTRGPMLSLLTSRPNMDRVPRRMSTSAQERMDAALAHYRLPAMDP